jgi:hypothetical protein
LNTTAMNLSQAEVTAAFSASAGLFPACPPILTQPLLTTAAPRGFILAGSIALLRVLATAVEPPAVYDRSFRSVVLEGEVGLKLLI